MQQETTSEEGSVFLVAPSSARVRELQGGLFFPSRDSLRIAVEIFRIDFGEVRSPFAVLKHGQQVTIPERTNVLSSWTSRLETADKKTVSSHLIFNERLEDLQKNSYSVTLCLESLVLGEENTRNEFPSRDS